MSDRAPARAVLPANRAELRPAVSVVRSAILVVVLGVFAMLSHRVELLVLAAPFVVWGALAVVRRPPAPVAPEDQLSTQRLGVGQNAEFRLWTADPGMIVALSVPRPQRCDVEPPLGSAVGSGQAAVKIRPERWGRHHIEPGEANLTDAWGMWAGRWTPRSRQVTVAPGIGTPGGGDAIPHPIGLVGIHPSRARGDGSALAEIRPFVSGDRLRRVNWRVTSRTGSLHTNATTAERDTEVLVVLDTLSDHTVQQEGRNDTGNETSSSLDITVAAAATIADHYLGLGDRVGLHDLGRVIGSIPAGSGARQRAVITDRLARGWVERVASSSGVRRTGRLRAGSLVLCCTPLLDPDVVDEVLRLLHRGAAVLVVDTLPPRLGLSDVSAVHPTGWRGRIDDRVRSRRYWDEAWAIRRLERQRVITGLERLGVPVVAWEGIGSLAHLIGALAANRSAPRMARH